MSPSRPAPRRADNFTGGGSNRRYAQRNRNLAAIPAVAYRFVMLDQLSPRDLVEDLPHLEMTIGRHDQINVLADGRFRRMTKHLLGGRIPCQDSAVERVDDDRIDRCLDRRSQLAFPVCTAGV